MYALTLKQPWAYAISDKGKLVENRSWIARHALGRDIAIHAGAEPKTKRDREEVDFLLSQLDDVAQCSASSKTSYSELTSSALVAVVRVDGFVSGLPDDQVDPRCSARGKGSWYVGPIGWLLSNVRVLPEPVACKGKQGLWTLSPELATAVAAQVEVPRG